jgi:hypothetical protein
MSISSIVVPESIARRKTRWDALEDMSTACSPVWVIYLESEADARPYPWPTNIPARIEWAWKAYQRDLERMAWLADDRIPCLDPYTGTEIFAAAFGCSVYRPVDNMPFAQPLVFGANEVAGLKVPDIDVAPLRILFEIADELRHRAGPEAMMRLPDIQSPFDIAALIWDKRSFYTALVDCPEAVQELTAKVEELLTAFVDEWFRRYGVECVAHYPHYYMRQGITVSVDEVGSMSARMASTFVMPELERLSRRYGGIGVHCCANASHQWANFKRLPDLRLINLFRLERPGILMDASTYFAEHVAQLHNWEVPLDSWLPAMPAAAHVAFETTAHDGEEARRLADSLWRTYRR